MTPNEHIEFFKRFAAAYMRWVNFNFDRIASDVIKKHSPSQDRKGTSAEQLGRMWNDQKALRNKINWPDDGTFDGLRARVQSAIEMLKAPKETGDGH